MKRRTPLTEGQKRQWSNFAQLACLKGLADQEFEMNELVFHGGTSLKFSWGSPRFSEDLDFMVSKKKSQDLSGMMKSVLKTVEIELQKINPDFTVRLKEKVRREGQLLEYTIAIERKDIMGATKIKVEFWEVEDKFLDKYETRAKIPQDRSVETRIYTENPLSVAELKSAYCDKLVALSTRPHLKWRDLFDIWWLRTQNDLAPLKDPEFLEFFKHNLSAYSLPEGMTLESSLSRYLNWDKGSVLEKSQEDLQHWLSPSLWKRLYPKTVMEMIELVEKDIKSLLDALSLATPKPNNINIKP